jgi:hypothetical protein
MSAASIEQQDGTFNLGANRREIPWRANLLEMLGLSHDLSPATLRPQFGPLSGRRIVPGREADCEEYYKRFKASELVKQHLKDGID